MSAKPTSADDLLTADEFMTLLEPENGGRMELVAGRVLVEMPVGERHAAIATELAVALHPFVKQHRLGRVYVELGYRLSLDPDTVRAPDVSVASTGIERPVGDRYLDGPPTLAIEVMSPEDREGDVARKVEEYFDAGVSRVWIVRPRNQTVTVHHPGGDAHTYTASDALTSKDAGFSVDGLRIDLAALFAE
ncbi:MAG TPA: Uma2 family endonuclease [Tepidiformaceae bacterium]|nr:Uma2 family endonuclease [Tepidiformaceae bacterium]